MRYVVVCLLVAVGLVFIAPTVRADDGSTLTDDQAAQVSLNCKQAQSVMQRLGAADVATRVTRGRVYENLITKLINPFNSRVASNNLDTTDLLIDTNAINKSFSAFKSDYSAYNNFFTKTVSIDCESQPRDFYDALTQTRNARAKVASDISELNAEIARYETSFTSVRASIGR